VQVANTGPTYYWNKKEERRIYVAKEALKSLVRSTNMDGNSDRDVNRPVDQIALVWFTHTVDKNGYGNFKAFSSVPGDVINNINSAGTSNGDTYRTNGGTNGAAGLFRAALALANAPSTVTVAGKTWDYKRVVIFITDGVSNQFLDKGKNNLYGGQSSNNTYPVGHICRTMDKVVEVASCQVTGTGSNGGGLSIAAPGVVADMDRPITQAGNVSRQDIQPKGIEVFAISLSNIPDTGLSDSIASFPTYYFPADELIVDGSGKTNVDTIMATINTKVEDAPCSQRTDVMDGKPEWLPAFPAADLGSFDGLTLTYPNVGEVILENVENGASYRIPITVSADGTKMSYTKDKMPKGNYKLSAYLYYRHPLDLPTAKPRVYSLIDTSVGEAVQDIVINVGPQSSDTGSFNQQVRQDIKLRLDGDVCKAT